MIEQIYTHAHKLRFLAVALLMLASVSLLTTMIAVATTSGMGRSLDNTHTTNTSSKFSTGLLDNENIVAASIATLVDTSGRAVGRVGSLVGGSLRTTASVAVQGSKAAIGTIHNGIAIAGRGVGSGTGILLGAVSNILGSIPDAPVVSAFVRPHTDTPIPVIDPSSAYLQAALYEAPAAAQASGEHIHLDDSGTTWPIHGRVTAQFGIPHWPYQPIHTGIDISDGQGAGNTPVKSFKSGRVIETVYTRSGLGNHVVVDHGGGLTSVYAHLDSIAAHVGQEVNTTTMLGYAGTTGVSTGTHLHFEVRQHGQPMDPRQFISGQP